MFYFYFILLSVLIVRFCNKYIVRCYGLFTHSREFVQLCYKYDIDIALCSSGAIFAAVCSDFSHVVFSSFSKSVCLLSILLLVTVCSLPLLANKRHQLSV